MRRLNGIGVSPGVVSGRAVILIQRGHVLRYQIGERRLGSELARLEKSREQSRQQLHPIESRALRDLVEIIGIPVVHRPEHWIVRRGIHPLGFFSIANP